MNNDFLSLNMIINRIKGKILHFKRKHSPKYNLHFIDHLNARKQTNKAILLRKLIDATNTDEFDYPTIMQLENLIEQRKREGIVSEFYTNPLEGD